MAEDNARDMRKLRKLRSAIGALIEVQAEATTGETPMHFQQTLLYLEKRAEHIEAVWN